MKNSKNFAAEHRYNRRSVILFAALSFLFLLELCVTVYHSGVMAESNQEMKEYREQAVSECDKNNVVMGDITDRSGTVLLGFQSPSAKDRGTYIDGLAYSNVIGYCAQSPYSYSIIKKYEKVLMDTPTLDDTKGNSIHLTLDHELQMETMKVLKNMIGEDGRGSMVVMDAETGEILSMVSMPTFDVTRLDEEMKWMSEDTDVWYPLATVGDIAPGSTFKVLSSIVLLENGMENHTETDASFRAGNYVIHNYYNDSEASIDYKEALRKSSNVFFAKSMLSLDSNGEKLTEAAKRLYIGEDLELDFGPVISNWSMDESTLKLLRKNQNFDMDYVVAASAFGQSEIRFSALNGAMLAAAVINEGKLMTPYMIQSVTDCNEKEVNLDKLIDNLNKEGNDKNLIKKATGESGEVLSQVTSKKVADKVLEAMKNAAAEQYGFDPELNAAAKSGTSETGMDGNSGNNSWMISCAEINGHKYAVAVNWAKSKTGIVGSNMKVPVEAIYQYLKNREN